MITKEKFIYYMDKLIDKYKKLNEMYVAVENVTGVVPDKLIEITNESLSITLLEEMIEDTDNWIEWFFYETDCGEIPALVVDENGKEISVKTSEDLWNLIR